MKAFARVAGRRRCLLCGLLVIIGLSATAWAQGVTGIISGVVSDPSKAAVAGATVTISNVDTGVIAWTGKTNSSGVYRAPGLPVGGYTISVQAAGFKGQKVAGFRLSVDQRADIDINLEVGELSQTVDVMGAQQAQLATDTASLGNTISPSQVQDLPLPSRAVLNLLALTPGVSYGGDITSQGGLSTAQLSINGSRTLNSEFLIDGVSVITGSTGGPQSLPPVDSIQEFKVLAASYSSEYGRSSGGVITLVTNSGTNQYHGAAYGYFRNEEFDANPYFNNVLGKKRQEDRYNLFGGKIGGPLSIPKIYHGKNKTFFFLNYEGLIQALPYSNTSSIPYGAYATGDFSASPTVVASPTTHVPFPGNVIPPTSIDQAALKILGLVPNPNSPGVLNKADNVNTLNYVSIGSSHPENNTGVARIDESISERTRLFGTFVHFNNYSPIAPTYPGSPLESSVGNSATTGYESTAGITQTWNSTFVTELRFGYFRNNSEIRPPSEGINDQQTLGIGTSYGVASPEFNFGSGQFSLLGTNSNTQRTQIDNNYQLILNNSKVWGNHLLTFGVQLRKNEFDDLNPTGEVNGSYSFDGSITSPKSASNDTINELADFLLGKVKTGSYSLPQPLIGRRNYNLAAFLQDDWKIRSNLTLNLGLRWEYEAPFTTANNEYSRIDPTTGAVLFAGQNASNTLNLSAAKRNFGPRVGLAWSPISKTVIRSGFGIFYAGIFSDLGGQVLFPGYTVVQSFASLGTGVAQPFSLSQGLPRVATYNVSNPQANIAQFGTAANPLVLTDYDGFTQVNKLPYAEQWNFGIQRDVGMGIVAEVNFVGTHGVHLAINMPTNTVPYDPVIDTAVGLANTSVATQLARPFPGIGSFNSLNMEGVSTYEAAQVSVRKQVGTSLSFIVNYTHSRSIDDASGIYSFSQPSGLNLGEVPQQFLNINKGLSEFDRPNDLTAAVQFRTKGNKWVRNFQVFPMISAHTGLPLYIGQTNENAAQTGTTQQRPNLTAAGVSLLTPETPNGTGVQYLLPDTAANFPLAPTGPFFSGSGAARTEILPVTLGNLGRNVVRAPGQLSANISVGRAFDLRERLRFTIRMEAYNALNHTNFSPPASSLAVSTNAAGTPIFNSTTYGLINATGQARFLQLVGRIEF